MADVVQILHVDRQHDSNRHNFTTSDRGFCEEEDLYHATTTIHESAEVIFVTKSWEERDARIPWNQIPHMLFDDRHNDQD